LLVADGEGEVTFEHEERLLELSVDMRHRPRARAATKFREREPRLVASPAARIRI
jgi:hypothetical protein